MGVYRCPNHKGDPLSDYVPTLTRDVVDFGDGVVFQWCKICRKYVRRVWCPGAFQGPTAEQSRRLEAQQSARRTVAQRATPA